MAKYAEIKNGIIENVIVADADFIAQYKPEAIECPEWVGVGDEYTNGEFARVVIEQIVEEEITE